MIDSKFFEVRDEGTFIPVVCQKFDMHKFNGKDKYLFRRAGWQTLISYSRIYDMKTYTDIYNVDCVGRTDRIAYQFIHENWDTLKSGDIVDVAFILGMRDSVCDSEYEGQYD